MEDKNYSDLLRWVVNDLKDLPKKDLMRVGARYLQGSIGTLDMFGVVTTQQEFEAFKKDVESQTGMIFE